MQMKRTFQQLYNAIPIFVSRLLLSLSTSQSRLTMLKDLQKPLCQMHCSHFRTRTHICLRWEFTFCSSELSLFLLKRFTANLVSCSFSSTYVSTSHLLLIWTEASIFWLFLRHMSIHMPYAQNLLSQLLAVWADCITSFSTQFSYHVLLFFALARS